MDKKIVAVYGAADQALIKQFPFKKPIWGNCEFVINEACTICDYLFMIDSVKTTIEVECIPQNTYLCICEPKSVKIYPSNYVDQFSNLISFRPFNHFEGSILYDIPMLPWRVGSKYNPKTGKSDYHNFLDYDFLTQRIDFPKLDKVAIITSNKVMTKGHRRRLDFLLKLKENIPEFIDIYGQGFQFVEDKGDVLSKYKYVFAFENCRENGYVTEKIFDSFISEALPLYWGAPDISSYCSENSYVIVDFHSVKEVSDLIVAMIKRNEYEKRVSFILSEKEKALNYYNIFARIAKIVEEKPLVMNTDRTHCIIHPEKYNLAYRLKQRIYRAFCK